MPVSLTSTRTSIPPAIGLPVTATVTRPRSVNLTALDTRLITTWRRRAESPRSHAGSPGSTDSSSSTPFSLAATSTVAQPSAIVSRRAKSVVSSSILPASIFE